MVIHFVHQSFAVATILATVAIAFASSTSCGGDDDDTPESTNDVAHIPEGQLPTVLEAAGNGEREFLEDGVVIFEEYQQAVFNFVRCGEEAGLSFGNGPVLRKWREYTFEATSTDALPGDQIMSRCRIEHFNEVQRWWASVAQPSEAELQEGFDWMGNCLREMGVEDVPEHPSGKELLELGERFDEMPFDAFGNCGWAMYQTFGFPILVRGN